MRQTRKQHTTLINLNAGGQEVSIFTNDQALQRKLHHFGVHPHMRPRKKNASVGVYRIPAAWLSIQPKQRPAVARRATARKTAA